MRELPPVNSPEILLALFEAFGRHLLEERKRSLKTRNCYLADLRIFGQWLARKRDLKLTHREAEALAALEACRAAPGSLSHEVVWITDEDYTQFFTELEKQRAAPPTIFRKVASLSGFYRWLEARKVRGARPVLGLRLTRPKSTAIKIIDQARLDLFLKSIPATTPRDLRDRAITLVLIDTGMRIGELVALNVGDFNDGKLRCVRRGRGERLLNLSEVASDTLRSYLRSRGERADTAMFLNKDGTRISARSIRRRLETRLEQAGLSPGLITPTMLMHRRRFLHLQAGGSHQLASETFGLRSGSRLAEYDGCIENVELPLIRALDRSTVRSVSVPATSVVVPTNKPPSQFGRATPLYGAHA